MDGRHGQAPIIAAQNRLRQGQCEASLQRTIWRHTSPTGLLWWSGPEEWGNTLAGRYGGRVYAVVAGGVSVGFGFLQWYPELCRLGYIGVPFLSLCAVSRLAPTATPAQRRFIFRDTTGELSLKKLLADSTKKMRRAAIGGKRSPRKRPPAPGKP